MPIQLGDVKLVTSAVMDDVPEGGGGPTSHIIEDNEDNEIFKDISESDRARGRLNMSKTFVSVQTPDTDTYLGVNAIVAKPPEDPNVTVTMFTTDSVYDTRQEAKARLEAYLNKGAEWGGFLYENHIAGQRSVQFFQREGSEVPAIGKTLALVQNEGLSSEREQYIRATRVSSVVRTFTYDGDKDYRAMLVTLEISDALRYDFTGTSANRQFLRAGNATKVRDTVVADAANYAGVVPLALPIALGDFSLKATTIYTPLVPSAQVETPIVATSPYARAALPVRSGNATTFSTSQAWTTTTAMTLPGGALPGTVSVVIGGVTVSDRGGRLMVGDQQVGTVDYSNGILTLATGSYPGAKQVTYEPAAYVQRMPQSEDTLITAENRSQNYTGFINPLAMPGTLSVSYQVQGRWYVLSDAGDGALRGFDTSHGAGTYSPDSGSFVVTLGGLPDVGSSVIRQWGVPTQEFAHPRATLGLSQTVALDADAADMLDPSYLKATWQDGGVTKTATGTLAGGLTGDATGAINVAQKTIRFQPNTMPVVGTQITFEYDTGPRNERHLAHPSRGGDGRLPVNAGDTNLVPGSVVVEWNTLTDLSVYGTYTSAQLEGMGIGLGQLVDPTQEARDNGSGRLILNGKDIGSVNYATGDIVFQPDAVIKVPNIAYRPQVTSGTAPTAFFPQDSRVWRLNYAGINYIDTASIYPNDESGYVNIKFYKTTGASRKTKVVGFAPALSLVTGTKAPVVPGSVLLVTNQGEPWGDSGNGVLREFTATGWLQRGTINYVDGVIDVTSWTTGASSSVVRESTITTLGENVASVYVFRTAAAPIRPGSLSLQFAGAGGGTQVVTADIAGNITASGILGIVDYQTGLVRVAFGGMVTAAGNENEPWYDASQVVGGMIFKPAPVAGSTLKYTAVAYTYMPLNADLVGVDPVRLPSDGRVPIFRPGTMVVVGNTKVTGPLTPTNAQVINLARTRLSRAVVRDAAGKSVYTGYTTDLEAGTLTFVDVSSMVTPVTIEDRIEDMLVASDVQISGDMTFTRQISHAYPTAGTYVSSALEFGDRKARVSTVFDQATWDGITWADAPTSAVAAASYNTTLSPIEVTNVGASTERFALQFTSTTAFRVVGEHVGVIATGDINTVCAPINPATGQPYFTVRPLGWGSGWAVGNIVRINTVGALAPIWVVRTTQPGPEAGIDYSFDLLTRGDVDRP